MKELSVSEWIKTYTNHPDKYPLIDVRSPGEFNEGHIPGAINIPLFSDEERALIGTIYKQESSGQAKWKAMEIVSPKIPELLRAIKNHSGTDQNPVIYCWRGGSRSGSVSTFAQLAGLDVLRLAGGYRAYREWCLEQLQPELAQGKVPVLLHGMTGVGKTEILKRLGENHPIIDLEKLANHRGSIFGQIGLTEPHNQKMFDSLLLKELHALYAAPYIMMEAESKRIGKAVQPDFLLEWRKNGVHLHLIAPLSFRVKMILKEYVLPYSNEEWFHEKARGAFQQIMKRLKPSDQEAAEQYFQFS